MFPRRMSLLEGRMNCSIVSTSRSNVTREEVAVLGKCCPSGRDSYLNLLVLVFCLWCCISVPGGCSFQRSRPECCCRILVCRLPPSPLSIPLVVLHTMVFTYFHHLIPVAFGLDHVVYYLI